MADVNGEAVGAVGETLGASVVIITFLLELPKSPVIPRSSSFKPLSVSTSPQRHVRVRGRYSSQTGVALTCSCSSTFGVLSPLGSNYVHRHAPSQAESTNKALRLESNSAYPLGFDSLLAMGQSGGT